MAVRTHLLFALVGWLAGVVITLGVAFVIFPALFGQVRTTFGQADLVILGLVLLLVSPAALAGGIAGGRMAQEGGQRTQIVLAAIVGIIIALPFSCVAFWYTGW